MSVSINRVTFPISVTQRLQHASFLAAAIAVVVEVVVVACA